MVHPRNRRKLVFRCTFDQSEGREGRQWIDRGPQLDDEPAVLQFEHQLVVRQHRSPARQGDRPTNARREVDRAIVPQLGQQRRHPGRVQVERAGDLAVAWR